MSHVTLLCILCNNTGIELFFKSASSILIFLIIKPRVFILNSVRKEVIKLSVETNRRSQGWIPNSFVVVGPRNDSWPVTTGGGGVHWTEGGGTLYPCYSFITGFEGGESRSRRSWTEVKEGEIWRRGLRGRHEGGFVRRGRYTRWEDKRGLRSRAGGLERGERGYNGSKRRSDLIVVDMFSYDSKEG